MFFLQDTKKQVELDFIFDKIDVITPFGVKEKRKMDVYKADQESALNLYFDKLEKLIECLRKYPDSYKKLCMLFSHFKEIELTVERIKTKEVLSVSELFEIKYFAMILKLVSELSEKEEFLVKFDRLKYVEELLDPDKTGVNTFYIYDNYSKKLAHIRHQLKELQTEIKREKKKKREALSKELSIKIKPNDEIYVQKHRKNLIEKLKEYKDIVYVSEASMHVKYKLRADVIELEEKIDSLKLEEEKEEYEIRRKLSLKLFDYIDDIIKSISDVAAFDLLLAKAYFADKYNMTRPIIGSGLKIEEGIHLKVEEKLKEEHLEYMPISVKLDHGIACITGANMGGKTICLKLIAQMQLMAQYAMFVPCKSFEFELLNFVFLSSQDAQSVDKGLSTFGAEMVNISEVINVSDNNGLILIDELARGTNPKEGFAISKAIINYLKSKSSISVVTTHFDGLADDEDITHLQVRGLSEVDFDHFKIDRNKFHLEALHNLMDYRLKVIEGPEEVPKDAINISKVIGVDENILKDARRILESREE